MDRLAWKVPGHGHITSPPWGLFLRDFLEAPEEFPTPVSCFNIPFFVKSILLIMLLQLSQLLSPFYSPSTLQHSPHLSSCPYVVHISSLDSLFPILFLNSPHLFYAYQLCFLFPVLFHPILPLPSPWITFHVISISVILFLF